ncbi:zinc-dependent metalloprotease, partial [Flagellimonas pacifica]
ILLKPQSIRSTAGIILPVAKGLTLMDNVLATFPIKKNHGRAGGYCVNITSLVMKQDIQWPQQLGVSFGTPIPEISVLVDSKNLENEVIVKTRRGMVKHRSKVSVPVYYGFCALPEPMKARRYDYRMGFINEHFLDIDHGIHEDGTHNSIANISRWRLEKKYKDRSVSVPVRPITFILSPEIPKKWRSYVKAGILEWLPAFEAAGFKDAITVKEADSLSDWQLYGIGNNIVHWGEERYFRDRDQKEYGGTIARVIDYRTGELLKSDIFLNASRQTLEERYFTRASPLDKRAQSFPFPDGLTGRLFQCLAAHETGHTLGLKDGNFGEFSYPVKKMKDKDWLGTMGYTPSIMNYTRTNNVTQPEDGVPPSMLLQRVGPADIHSISWGYREFQQGISSNAESAALEAIIRSQDSISWLRYIDTQFEVMGPGRTNEVVETNDPVKSTALALKNLERVVGLIPGACVGQKDNAQLVRLYNKSVELWYHHMLHVVSVIGGYHIHYKSPDQPGEMFVPIPWEAQQQALDYLLINAFDPPEWLTAPKFDARIRYSTFPDKVAEYEHWLILELVQAHRLKRLEQMENIFGNHGLVQSYLEQLQSGLFKELNKDMDREDRRRQEIQMIYIEGLVGALETKRAGFDPGAQFIAYTDYSKGILMHQLMGLKKNIEKELKRNGNGTASGHWQLCLKKINTVL